MSMQSDGTGDTPVQDPSSPPSQPESQPSTAPTAQDTDELRFSRDAFNERLKQARTSAMAAVWKELGFESKEQALEFKKSADEAASAAEKARREKMDENERIKLELEERDKRIAEAESAREMAEQEAEASRIEAHLHRVFIQKGITATDYAMFKLEQKANSLGENEEDFDENAFLDELLSDPRERFSLGVVGADAPPAVPAQTTGTQDGPNPPQPQNGDPKHVSQMSDAEWRAHKAKLTGNLF